MPKTLEEETRLAPRSLVVRRRPLLPPGGKHKVQTARASQLVKPRAQCTTTTEEIQEFSRLAASPRPAHRGGSWLLPLGLGMFCALLLALSGSMVLSWSSTLIDQIHYGYPRTTQVDHFVGHERDPRVPTHFTAMNLKGVIMILEAPGGDPEHAHLLLGPHLVGPNTDLAPITLTFSEDTRHPDLVVTVGSLQVMFHNTGTSYEPMR